MKCLYVDVEGREAVDPIEEITKDKTREQLSQLIKLVGGLIESAGYRDGSGFIRSAALGEEFSNTIEELRSYLRNFQS